MTSVYKIYKKERKRLEVTKEQLRVLIAFFLLMCTAISSYLIFTGDNVVIYDINNFVNIIRPLLFTSLWTYAAYISMPIFSKNHKNSIYISYLFVLVGITAIFLVVYTYSVDLYERNYGNPEIVQGKVIDFRYSDKGISIEILERNVRFLRHGLDFAGQLNPNFIEKNNSLIIHIGSNKQILRIEKIDNKAIKKDV